MTRYAAATSSSCAARAVPCRLLARAVGQANVTLLRRGCIPLKPFFLGSTAAGPRVTSSRRCFARSTRCRRQAPRATLTFLEMLELLVRAILQGQAIAYAVGVSRSASDSRGSHWMTVFEATTCSGWARRGGDCGWEAVRRPARAIVACNRKETSGRPGRRPVRPCSELYLDRVSNDADDLPGGKTSASSSTGTSCSDLHRPRDKLTPLPARNIDTGSASTGWR